ncbi:hypothetical protein ACX9NE_26780 [Mycobacterium sp. ML4]
MAKLSDFIPQAEINAYLETAPEVLAGKLELANEVVDYARSIAPEDEGDYKRGIRARRRGRTGVSVEFSDPKSNLIEDGSIHNEPFHIKARTEAHFKQQELL